MPRERIRTGKGELAWEPVLKNGLTGLAHEGKWDVFGGALRVDSTGTGSWLSLTDRAIEDFEFRTAMTAVEKGNASIFFRQQAGKPRYYQFDLRCGIQAVVVSMVDGDAARPRTLDAVNFELTPGMRYEVEIAVRGESILSFVNGQRMNHVRAGEYPAGGICLTAWNSRPEFYDPRLRVY